MYIVCSKFNPDLPLHENKNKRTRPQVVCRIYATALGEKGGKYAD